MQAMSKARVFASSAKKNENTNGNMEILLMIANELSIKGYNGVAAQLTANKTRYQIATQI